MKRALLLAAMFCLLLSCTKEEISFDERIPINIAIGQQTRANDDEFATGDKVGIYVVNYNNSTAGTFESSGNHADNAGFTLRTNEWTPDETIYWKNKNTSADFYAYYPYSSSITDINAHPFSVQADQSSEENFWASDFLWGKAQAVTPTSAAVPIVTNHVLSRIIVEIKPGEGFTNATLAEALESVVISGLKTSAKIDLSTGISTEDGDAQEITPFYDSKTGYYKAMIIPQTTVEGSKLIVINTKDGTKYVYRKGYEFKSNTQHKFTITVNRSSTSINVTIGEWIIDTNVNTGFATEEEEEIEIPSTIPDNEIWYTTSDGTKWDFIESDPFGNTFVTENTYIDNKGILTCYEPISTIPRGVFYDKDNLTSIILPGSITSISNDAFNNCSNLSSIELSTNLSTIGEYAFNYCVKLSSIEIPTNVTTIKAHAFEGCINIQTIISKATNAPGLGEDAFKGISSSCVLKVPSGCVSKYKNSDWNQYFSNIEEI